MKIQKDTPKLSKAFTVGKREGALLPPSFFLSLGRVVTQPGRDRACGLGHGVRQAELGNEHHAGDTAIGTE